MDAHSCPNSIIADERRYIADLGEPASAFICGSFQTLSRAPARRIAKQTLSLLNLEVRGAGTAQCSAQMANPDAGLRRGRGREVDGLVPVVGRA